MCLLLESIRIENRRISLADEHSSRMNRSRRALFGAADLWDLKELLTIPPGLTNAVYKCRVLYDTAVRSVEFIPYTPRIVRSLQMVDAPPALDYSHKYADRSDIDRLYAQRGRYDDILIVRNGCITDTSFSNIALYDGSRWYTPARPLLRGVRVQALIGQGVVHERDIRPDDLGTFHRAILLNAMLGFEEEVEVDIHNIGCGGTTGGPILPTCDSPHN